MKKILCFFIIGLLVVLLVVPCFAVETTVAPSDPVDWFGGTTEVVGYYSYTCPSYNELDTDKLPGVNVTVAAPFSFGSVSFAVGDTMRFAMVSSRGHIFKNDVDCGTTANAVPSYPFTFYIEESSYTAWRSDSSFEGTPVMVTVGADGFVDSGFSDALSELSIIVSAILSNQYILIAIGLAVAVPLVAWGISKIKSLVKGY